MDIVFVHNPDMNRQPQTVVVLHTTIWYEEIHSGKTKVHKHVMLTLMEWEMHGLSRLRPPTHACILLSVLFY